MSEKDEKIESLYDKNGPIQVRMPFEMKFSYKDNKFVYIEYVGVKEGESPQEMINVSEKKLNELLPNAEHKLDYEHYPSIDKNYIRYELEMETDIATGMLYLAGELIGIVLSKEPDKIEELIKTVSSLSPHIETEDN